MILSIGVVLSTGRGWLLFLRLGRLAGPAVVMAWAVAVAVAGAGAGVAGGGAAAASWGALAGLAAGAADGCWPRCGLRDGFFSRESVWPDPGVAEELLGWVRAGVFPADPALTVLPAVSGAGLAGCPGCCPDCCPGCCPDCCPAGLAGWRGPGRLAGLGGRGAEAAAGWLAGVAGAGKPVCPASAAESADSESGRRRGANRPLFRLG